MDGIALNISSGGAFVRFKELIPKGETLSMTLKPPNHTPLKVTIETMWTDKYIPSGKEIKPIGIGVRFAKVSDVDRQFVSTVVADLLKLEHVKESKVKRTDPHRFKNTEINVTLDEKFGQFCVRYKLKVEDHNPVISGISDDTVLIMTGEGYTFIQYQSQGLDSPDV